MNNLQHISTASHWYTADGQPAHNATLREARKQRLIPSVTTCAKLLDKPALTNWIVNEVLKTAVQFPRGLDEPPDVWIKRVSEESQRIRLLPAQRGTEIHAAIEQYLTTRIPPAHDPTAQRACEQIHSWLQSINANNIECEKCAVNPRAGIAGRVDMVINGTMIADVKTTAKMPRGAWPGWKLQIGGYHIALDLPPSPAFILAVDSTSGDMNPIPITQEDVYDAIETFHLLTALWRRIHKYDPRQGQETK